MPQSTFTEAPEPRLAYRPAEVADLLGLSREMVYKLLRSGGLRSVRAGTALLVPGWALDEFIGLRADTDEE